MTMATYDPHLQRAFDGEGHGGHACLHPGSESLAEVTTAGDVPAGSTNDLLAAIRDES
jgi:hypothetical protein